ncbi:MAG: type IV secretory system conjugative DNA transfer family protein [Erysipelotrichales bacterium]|nr:type IV secretory system conjugative DNA transfer family protein [Erysipelotrichales bacterium]
MKLKVSGKDLAIFSVFCLFLLYFSAIAVLNVFTLLNDGEFYGLSPFEAFTGKYILGTLLVFFAVIIAIFFSVSSSIFERKGGIGLEIGQKEEKGYSRWLKEKEMKKAYKVFRVGVKDETAATGGIVLINDGKNMWVDDSEYHTLVIGVTGSGKTSAVVDPLTYSLVKHGESMVFTDPKGEIYKDHGELLKARGYKIIVLNFRDPQMGNAWNPLTLPYQLYKDGNVDKAIELIDDVANNIVKDKTAPSDPFWQNSSSDYFAGCTLGLLEDAKEEEVNINSIGYMTTVGEEKFGAGSTYIQEYFKMKGEQSSAYTFASNTINSPTETKGGILSTFRQKIRIFSSRENLSEMLSYSDFNMRDIGREKTAVFMIIHDEKTTYHALATIFIKQCYETLISVAQENGGKLPVRTNFILDEFANMPALKDVTTMVTAARSRLIRFTFIIQNFAQLNEVYGKEDAETIRSNCGNLIYILTTELAALEEISKLCGEVKSKKEDKTESRPLVTVSDLQKMKMNEVIILRSRQHPFKTQLVQAYTVDWGTKYPKAELMTREKKEIQLFDVLEFVKVRKRSKMGIDDKNPANPFGGGAPNFGALASSGFGGMGTPPKIPTFEEFMAARNAQKAAEQQANQNASINPGINPSINPAQQPVKPKLPSFDVDDLVKRIDAKIAELEAQEKAEEEAKKNGGKTQENTDAKPNTEEQTLPKTPIETSSDILGTNETKESSDEPVVKVDNSSTVQEVKAEPVSDIGFNPFNLEPSVTENTFNDKDIIKTDVENPPIETTPITAPVIEDVKEEPKKEDSTQIENFADLLKKHEETSHEPSVMIENPIDISTEVPNIPKSPIIVPQVEEEVENNAVTEEKVEVEKQTEPSVQSVEIKQPEIIDTRPQITNQEMNNQPNNTVINQTSNDAFFDDFFEDD